MAFDTKARVSISADVTGQASVDRLGKSIGGLGETAQISQKQIAQAFRLLPAQFTDIATQLAGGQNPFLILLQQGGQIKDSFGGFGQMFRSLAGWLTPFRLGVLGLGSAALLAGKAFYDGEKEVSDFNKAIALTGNIAGMTLGDFRRLSQELSNSTSVTIGAAKDLVQAAVASGAFGPEAMASVTKAMALVQKLSGDSAENVVKDFAKMSSSVSDWAREHARAYGFINVEQYRYIKSLEAQGKYEEAAKYSADLLTAALEKRKPELGALEKMWDAIKKAASGAWDAMLGIGREKSTDEKLAGLRDKVKSLEAEQARERKGGMFAQGKLIENQPLIDELNKQIEILEKKKAAEEKAAQDEAALREKNARDVAEYDRMQAARKELAIQLFKSQADSQIQELEREETAYKRQLELKSITEQQYVQKHFELKRRELEIQTQLQEQLKGAEATFNEPKDRPEAKQKETRITAFQAEIDRLKKQVTVEEEKAFDQEAIINDRKKREFSKYNDELQHANDLIKEQAKQVQMTDFQYKQHIDTLNFEYELKNKTRDMTAQEAAEYEKLARAKFSARQSLEFDNYVTSKTALYGAQEAVKRYNEEVSNAAKSTQTAFTNAFKKTEDALVDFVMTGKFNFTDLANSIVKDLVRISIQQSIMKPLTDFLGASLSGGSSGWFGSLMSSIGVKAAANGASFDGQTAAFAMGGVVNSPTLFKFASGGSFRNGVMGEAGPEAILPLRRGANGKLGVEASMGGTSVVINNYSTEKASATERTDSRGNRRIEVTIGELVAGEVRRAGSAVQNSFRETFGAQTALVGR